MSNGNRNVPYSEFRELLHESEPEHWLVNEDEVLPYVDEVAELIETGSITIELDGRRYVMAIQVTDEGKI